MRWAPSCGLCGPGNRCEAWENGRHARAAQRGPRKIGQRYENVRRQSRELLYSIPAALCERLQRQARLNRKAGPKHADCLPGMEAFRFLYKKKSKVRPRDAVRHRREARQRLPTPTILQLRTSLLHTACKKKLARRSEATRQIASKSRVRYVAAPWLQEQFWT